MKVIVSNRAKKQITTIPAYIAEKLKLWVEAVEIDGIESVRKISGYHDEPLKGKRLGQRSIRLNKSYRAIYEIKIEGRLRLLFVEEVTKHGY